VSPGSSVTPCRLRLTGPPGSGVARLHRRWSRSGWVAPGSWASEGDVGDASKLADAWLAAEACDLRVALDADDLACLDRWHRWSGGGAPLTLAAGRAALRERRIRLTPARLRAQLVLDTTALHLATLERRVAAVARHLAALPPERAPLLVAESFAYARGAPGDADWCVDTRFLRNPYWEPSLRERSGRDPDVRAFVLQQPAAGLCLAAVTAALTACRAEYADRGRPVLRVAFGCTGGRHRSVAMATAAARSWRRRGWPVLVWHRDCDGDRSPQVGAHRLAAGTPIMI